MVKYLITGGCGFIGSKLAHALCERGLAVRIVDNLSTGKRENAPPSAEVLVGDILDPELMKRAVEGVSGVFHLAAIASMEKSVLDWSGTCQTNLVGTIRVLEALVAKQMKVPVIYTSSAAVYGGFEKGALHEGMTPKPFSPYGVDKWSGEKHLAVAWHLYKIPSISFRLFNVYGPGQDPHSPYSGVISIFAEKIRKGESVTIFGDGEQKRDFIFVGDVVKFLMAGIEKKFTGAHLFNLSTGRAIAIKELLGALEKTARKKAAVTYAEARKGDIAYSLGDCSSAEKFFGMSAQTKLEEGLSQCVGLS